MEIIYDSWDRFESMWGARLLERSASSIDANVLRSHDEDRTLRRCLEFCYLFPKSYEFRAVDIIRLWVAQGIFELQGCDGFEVEIASRYVAEFEQMQIFVMTHFDYHSTSGPRYRMNHSFVDLLEERHGSNYVRLEDKASNISKETLHFSLQDSSIFHQDASEEMYKAEKLYTLLIHHDHGSYFDQVPRRLFLKLPFLRALDFSHTNIKDLPSSIGNLKGLRYLNLSGTPITTLPNSLCNLHELQTLSLRGCSQLIGLPKGITNLINLQHLDVDVGCLLVSMPAELGKLRKLQTLPAFVVGRAYGCHLNQLGGLHHLRGTLSILRLENVSSSDEAKEVHLDIKKLIQKLELQWTELQDGHNLLEDLQPWTDLEELKLVGYGGAKFPGWIGRSEFQNLVTVSLCDCRKCEILPPLGDLPSLICLSVSDMHVLKTIGNEFYGTERAFPKLENLTLNAMPELEIWFGIRSGYFPQLQKLNISNCSKITSLPELSYVKSLQQLEISLCPLLESFPKEGLPKSLGCIVIIDCPKLKDHCHKVEGLEWGKLAHIATIRIDYQQISHEQLQRTHKFTMMKKEDRSNQKFKLLTSQEFEGDVLASLKKLAEEQLKLEDMVAIKVVGKGSSGYVQLFGHNRTGQLLVLKRIGVDSQEGIKSITHEVKINRSPYIVTCYQSWYDKGVISMLLEYMDGGSLADHLKKVNSIPEPYLAAISKQVLKGLLYLHEEKQIIHKDLKPSKVLINHRGEIKISNFGVSHMLAFNRSNVHTTFLSSYIYMSPERISGSPYGFRSNIWGLGLVLLECATGSYPYSIPKQQKEMLSLFEQMDAIVNEPPPCASPDQFSPEFCSFISACLQKDPKHRQDARKLVKHSFINKYRDIDVDLAAYFNNASVAHDKALHVAAMRIQK